MATTTEEENESILKDDDWDLPRSQRRGGGLRRACTKARLTSLAWVTVGLIGIVTLCLYMQVFRGFDAESRFAPSEEEARARAILWPVKDDQFVGIYGGNFVLVEDLGNATTETTSPRKDCQPLYLTGWNAWDISRAARISPRNHKTVGDVTGEEAVAAQFEEANARGLNVVRAWGHTVDPAYKVMRAPGSYDENGLRAIDYMVHQARKNGVRVILSFVDNWKYHGGVDEMVDFSRTAPERTSERPTDEAGDFSTENLNETLKEYEVRRHALFFTDEGARDVYKSHVRTLLTRRNHYSGVLYREDPAIFAWNLINEPRCESWLVRGCEAALQAWIEDLSAFVKKIDANHLVTIGSEGFFASNATAMEDRSEDRIPSLADANPANWAAQTGQDFVANHLPDTVDFATLHLWPDNWNQTSKDFQENWIDVHGQVARDLLGKPLIVQEFGKKLDLASSPGIPAPSSLEQREEVYEMVQAKVDASVVAEGSLKGSLFWNWEIDLMVGAAQDPYTLKTTDTTFALVKAHALKMHNASLSQIHSCDDYKRHPLY